MNEGEEMNRNLLILGAGQYGAVACETARAMGCFEKIDFLDDNSDLAIGPLAAYEDLAQQYPYAFVAIGNPKLRLKLIQELEEACFKVAVLVHPQACVSITAQLYKGTIVEPMAVVQANTTVAIGCIVSAGAVVNHNCFVGDVCHVDCGGIVPAGSIVPAGVKIDCGQIYNKAEGETVLRRCLEDYCFEDGM